MNSPTFVTSGDLTADRRLQWALGYIEAGDWAASADVLTQALELKPDFAAAWFALGETREHQGDRQGAIAAYEKARAADPDDIHGAILRLARLGELPPVPMPIGYVQALFDGYAARFDEALTEKLNYRAPDLLLSAVEKACARRPLSFDHALDLGCGTGLAGEAFRPFCRQMTGVDLSSGMLAEADKKNIYDRLVEAEVTAFLPEEAKAGRRYDLIMAADVFVYFHELEQVPRPVLDVLSPGGLLVFSLETHTGEGVILRKTLRYAHAADYVRRTLTDGGLRILSLEPDTARTEKGVPVPGLIVVASAP